ncbi:MULTISPECIES: LuxR C-terminal-related transcriptional regulator [unclassified Microbacterium]|uniref:helix-turn-helix transcriptional regulator n=1 Tax=unclassified Microbacterium TaxID=2609290 RepID=UPI000EAAC1A6|nr:MULTISPECIES: LuxR C-terminal-related transcriptional regulator [unclassified Microbacterium]MBT2483975.1 hypothetical protein [Microbacterium sp. ISL-108]RKN66940.1 hypothetical protein D7252_04605 [Microbacterium sp. CGR2]
MIGNENALNDSFAYVRAGVDVAIYGRPGSGRTVFLQRLGSELKSIDYRIVRVTGIAGLTHVHLAGLAGAFPDPVLTSRSVAVAAFMQRLVDEAADGSFAVIIDDADRLDDVSWGVIRAAQHRRPFPVVTSHTRAKEILQGARNPHLARAYQIGLQPLQLDEMERLLVARCGGPVDPTTVSRIFGKSGGLPGLAIGIVDVGVQEGRIFQEDGYWAACDDLWSSTLGRLVERHIGPLRRREREALETLSLSPTIDMAGVVSLLGRRAVERLEEKALLTFEMLDGQQRAAITPPLIAEYFRHLALPARSARMMQGEKTLLVAGRSMTPADASEFRASQPNAVFVRAVQDSARIRYAEASAAWRDDASAKNALAYLDSRVDSDVALPEIRAVIAKATPDSDLDAARLTLWHAAWLAAHGQLASATELLRKEADQHTSLRPLLQAARVRLAWLYEGYTGDVYADIDEPGDLARDVAGCVHVIRAAVLLGQGRIVAAEDEVSAVDPSSLEAEWAEHEVIRGFIRLAKGEHAEATMLAYGAFERARATSDAAAIRSTAYLAAFCQVVQGNYSEVTNLVETVLAVGSPKATAPSSLLGVLCIGSIAAGRSGNVGLAAARLEQVNRLLISDGPLPGMSASWARTQILLGEGRAGAARQEIRDGAERLWVRGARWSATMAHLIELELWPDVERLAALADRFDAVEGELVDALREYVEGLVHDDPIRLEGAGPRMISTGRAGFAINAYDHAAELYESAGKRSDAERLRNRAEALVDSLEPGSFDAGRFHSAELLLSAREIQLARLAAKGWSNQQIADELVLSVRTVESHLHRIMKKTVTSNRRALSRFLSDTAR